MQLKVASVGDERSIYTEEMREADRRREHESWLQYTRELQRLAGPCFAPGIDGVFWQRVRPAEADETGNPQTPILSILECTLKLDVDIHDSSKPPRQIWDAVLCYISSIPGCGAIEWGLGLDGDDHSSSAALFCLIHWDSVLAWWKFQHSPGFGPVFGLFASDLSNRCAKLGVSRVPQIGDARDGVVVDVITGTFDAKDVSSLEIRSAFGENWNALVASVTIGHGDSLRHSYTVWLENGVVTIPEPTPSEASIANKFTIFTAFLAWDGKSYDGRCVGELCDSLRGLLLSSSVSVSAISRKAVRFINEIPQEGHNPSQQPVRRYNSLASILETDFPRQCSPNVPSLGQHYGDILKRSIDDAWARKRLFPAPRGSFILGFQGSLFERSKTLLPGLGQQPTDGYHFLDVVWIQLKYRTPRAEAPQIYDQLKKEISTSPGCVKTYWARDVEHNKRIAVLTVWEGRDAREAGLHKYRQILDSFAASSAHLAAPLVHHAFPIHRGDRFTGPWLEGVAHLEIIRFYVSPGSTTRQVFEHAYYKFKRMAVPSDMGGGPSSACSVEREAGWQQPIEATESGSGFQLFTGVLTWANPEARLEWYEDLFKLSRESYEMFGQTLDTLKILAAGGVESRFLTLQRTGEEERHRTESRAFAAGSHVIYQHRKEKRAPRGRARVGTLGGRVSKRATRKPCETDKNGQDEALTIRSS